jgi:hypothetical protein
VSYMKDMNGKRFAFLTGKFNGTVFSGHPTRTTLGNSIRVILYLRFVLYKAGIGKYSLYVGGDDVFLIIEAEDLSRFE